MSTQMTSVRDRLRTFIAEELAVDLRAAQLTDDFALLDSGTIDSLGLFELIAFIDAAFGVVLDDGDLVYEHLRDLTAISALIEARRGEGKDT